MGSNHGLVLVPEDTALGKKILRVLADSGVHFNHCRTDILHHAAKVLKIGHHLYRIVIRKMIDLHGLLIEF